MNAGRLAEALEDRAVLRVLKKKRIDQARAVIRPLAQGCALVMATESVALEYECQCLFLLDKVLGRLCIEGVEEAALAVSAAVPCTWGETELKVLARRIKQIMEQRGVPDYTLHARAQEEISRPILTMAGSGVAKDRDAIKACEETEICGAAEGREAVEICGAAEGREAVEVCGAAGGREAEKTCGDAEACRDEKACEDAKGQPGASVVMAGYAALEATACVISARRELLRGQLSERYLDGGMKAALDTDMRPAIRLAREQGALVRAAGEGGIFTALWDLGRSLDCGMVVQLHEIPILQETIEVCEIVDVNPYQILSAGSILAVTSQPQELLAAYQRAGIPAAVIGKLTKEPARILSNGEEIRYLEPFRGDEIYRLGILHG